MYIIYIFVIIILFLFIYIKRINSKIFSTPTQIQLTSNNNKSNNEIKVLSLDDKRTRAQLVDTIARAFYDDPAYIWMFQGDKGRLKRIAWVIENGFMRLSANFHNTAVVMDDDGKQAIGMAAWVPPGSHIPTASILPILYAPLYIGWIASFRALAINFTFDGKVEEVMKHEPYWYLHVLGVDPNTQGKGYGKKLLETVLPLADKHKVCCYLETTNPKNVGYYEKFGFVVKKHIATIPLVGGPPMWFFRRDPK